MHTILEAKIEYIKGRIFRIIVLVEISEGDRRAVFATTMPRAGYTHIATDATLSDSLLQEVAGYGTPYPDAAKEFPKHFS